MLLIDDVVIIHHEPRPDGSRQMPEVGIIIPAHASALGKAMLAFDDDDAARLLSGPDLRSMTGETVTSPKDLRAQLDQIGATGLAREQDEAVIGEGAAGRPRLRLLGHDRRRDRLSHALLELARRPRHPRRHPRRRTSHLQRTRRDNLAHSRIASDGHR